MWHGLLLFNPATALSNAISGANSITPNLIVGCRERIVSREWVTRASFFSSRRRKPLKEAATKKFATATVFWVQQNREK